MRRFNGNGYSYPGVYAPGANIHVTNTYVTNVTHVNVGGGGHHKPRGGYGGSGKRGGFHERPPKLYRYCMSCGLLDSGVAAKMSSGQMCDETIKAAGYATRKFLADTRDCRAQMGRGLKKMASSIGGLIGLLVGG